jgi:hypothetical protein
MKKERVYGLLVVLLAFCFIFSGCDSPTTSGDGNPGQGSGDIVDPNLIPIITVNLLGMPASYVVGPPPSINLTLAANPTAGVRVDGTPEWFDFQEYIEGEITGTPAKALSGNFVNNMAYIYVVTLRANNGYTFTSNTNVQVDGIGTWSSLENGVLTVMHPILTGGTFPTSPITSIILEDPTIDPSASTKWANALALFLDNNEDLLPLGMAIVGVDLEGRLSFDHDNPDAEFEADQWYSITLHIQSFFADIASNVVMDYTPGAGVYYDVSHNRVNARYLTVTYQYNFAAASIKGGDIEITLTLPAAGVEDKPLIGAALAGDITVIITAGTVTVPARFITISNAAWWDGDDPGGTSNLLPSDYEFSDDEYYLQFTITLGGGYLFYEDSSGGLEDGGDIDADTLDVEETNVPGGDDGPQLIVLLKLDLT